MGDGALHYRDKVNVIAITPYGGTICFTLQYIKGEWKKITTEPFVNDKLLQAINVKMQKVTTVRPLIRAIAQRTKW
jgi:hypothetical protein